MKKYSTVELDLTARGYTPCLECPLFDRPAEVCSTKEGEVNEHLAEYRNYCEKRIIKLKQKTQ